MSCIQKTNIGTLIRFIGETQIPNIKINPNLLSWLGFVVTAVIIGIGSTVYVHKQGVARSGVGFEFLITSLSSFLLIDRVVELINKGITKTRSRLSKRKTYIINNILQSVAFKALIGSIFFQILVLIIIVNTPNPVYWKLFFGLVLVFCVARPKIKLNGSNDLTLESNDHSMGVELKDTAIVYDLGFDKRTVFDSLNISFDQGINYVWGANASGKSSLLNCIQGSIKIPKGKITINNNDVTNRPPHKRSIFLLSQNPFKSIAPELPVYENLVVANADKNNHLFGFYSYNKIIGDLEHSLALSELAYLTGDDENLFLQKTRNLSGGQAQRVLFYMALLSNDDVILADEPSSGLDIENLNRLVSIFEKLSLIGKTIIIATHDNRLSKMKGKHYIIKGQNIMLLK